MEKITKVNIFESLLEECIDLNIEGNDKESIIKNIINKISNVYNISNKISKELVNDVMAREAIMSTGMQLGIAIPHCTTNRLNELIVFIALSKYGVDFDSSDGSLSKIIVMLIVPEKNKQNHVKTLAHIARLLNEKETREKIINASSKQVIKEIFT